MCTRAPYAREAVWVPCPGCEDWWCRLHQMHAHDCPCPPAEDWEWPVDLYAGDPG